MPDDVATPKPSAATWINSHKGVIAGGVAVLGIGFFLYEHFKAKTATTSSTGSSVGSATGSSSPPPGSSTVTLQFGSSAGGFASGLANDIGSSVAAALKSQNNPSPASTGSAKTGSASPQTGSTTGGNPIVKPVVPVTNSSGAAVGTAAPPPADVTVKGIKFRPTRKVSVGGVTWYGIPDAATAAKLTKAKANVKNLLGGSGRYVQA